MVQARLAAAEGGWSPRCLPCWVLVGLALLAPDRATLADLPPPGVASAQNPGMLETPPAAIASAWNAVESALSPLVVPRPDAYAVHSPNFASFQVCNGIATTFTSHFDGSAVK